ncbi:MAG: hypothetical protein IJP38_05320 [Oscillospiraceae bacterium]|nr:hypothetical protein [Oscillospiraceae bacterium]MBQ9985708.1 hypothetical protein [Oscillospiraceae bacterium]
MKKLLSLILAIAMCITLLPTFASAADSEAAAQEWNFSNSLHGEKVDLSSVALFTSNATIDNFTGSTGLPWGFVDAFHTKSNKYTMKAYDGYSRIWLRLNSEDGNTDASNIRNIRFTPGLVPEDSVYQAVTFAIEVKKGGEYIPSIELGTDISSPKWEVYLTKKSDFEALVPANDEITSNNLYHERVKALPADDRLFIVDAYDSADTKAGYSAGGIATAEGGRARTVTAGVYYLTLISNETEGTLSYFVDSKSNSYATLFINSFSLNPVTAAETKTYSYDITTGAIKATSTKLDASTGTVLGSSFGDTNALPSTEINTANTDSYSIEVVYAENASKSYINSNGLVSAMFGNYFLYSSGIEGAPDDREPIVSFDLKNLVAGTYTLTISNSAYSATYGVNTKVYFGATPSTRTRTTYSTWRSAGGNGTYLGWHSSQNTDNVTFTVNVPSDGNYSLVFAADEESKEYNSSFDGTGASAPQYFHISGITLEGHAKEQEASAEQIAYNAAKAVKTEAIKAPVTGAPATAKVNVLTRNIAGTADANTVAEVLSADVGVSLTANAPQLGEKYEFLYWEKGIGAERRVVEDTERYIFTPDAGGTYLTAVYRNTESTDVPVVFYNQTGDEISKSTVAEGDNITFPADPSILGNNTFIGWKLAEDGEIYTSTDEITASGKTMRFVAQFEETPADTYNVTVTNSGISGTGEYTFGAKVSVSAPKRENGSGENVFAYWTKTVNDRCEIVSFDEKYEFLAGEDCTLTAVYKFYNPTTDALRRIMINENGTRLLAEFIGLNSADVTEKGILFNKNGASISSFADVTHKSTMKTDGNRFSVDNSDEFSYIGYAILTDGTVIYDK